jgi:hypothetical protein
MPTSALETGFLDNNLRLNGRPLQGEDEDGDRILLAIENLTAESK